MIDIHFEYGDIIDNPLSTLLPGHMVYHCRQCGKIFAWLDQGEEHEILIRNNGGICPSAP